MSHPKYPACNLCLPTRLCREHQIEEDGQVQARMAKLKSDVDKAGIVWEEPPPKSNAIREGKYGAALDLLMEHPKRWARIKDFAGNSSATSAAKNLRDRPIRPGKWEFKAIHRGRASRLYARYLGEGEQ